MRNLQALEPQGNGPRYGSPEAGELRSGAEVVIPSTAGDMPEARSGCCGRGCCAGEVAGSAGEGEEMKPRIRKVPGMPVWECVGAWSDEWDCAKLVRGHGYSPVMAYADWAEQANEIAGLCGIRQLSAFPQLSASEATA